MKTVYKFRDGSRLTGDAATVAHELGKVQKRHGALTAHTVLDAARRANSPLHDYFEWDDAKAAEAHRLDQAGHLIRSVQIIIDPEPVDASEPRQISLMQDAPAPAPVQRKQHEVRAFMTVSTAEGDRVYVPMADALGDAEYRRQVLQQAHAELGSIARKYHELSELAQVVEAIDRVGQLLVESSAAEFDR